MGLENKNKEGIDLAGSLKISPLNLAKRKTEYDKNIVWKEKLSLNRIRFYVFKCGSKCERKRIIIHK